MRRLFWFQTDLRLADHPGLHAQLDAEQLLLVYLWPRERPWCHQIGLGPQRERFLVESVQALREQLGTRGQDLLVLQGSPELVLPALVAEYGIDRVGCSRTPGAYEAAAVKRLRRTLAVPLEVYRGDTLLDEGELPFPLAELPPQFSPFRRAVERLAPTPPLPAPGSLPPPPAANFPATPAPAARAPAALPLRGGRADGERRLARFVSADGGLFDYKETRNGLDPLDGSSTLSPWLATGCLSPREAAAAITACEERHGDNESSYWLYFELLWREYYHWRALRDSRGLFRLHGNARRKRLYNCSFDPRNFARWCQGDTDFPLVNACMHQLVETGWMSNRGRQLAASCLIHDYGIDWRYGAAFFERHLIDYDVASNYGNWQYIAGVGADPRGGRSFDQAKQAERYDPDGIFTAKWDGYRARQPAFVTDAADWPIEP